MRVSSDWRSVTYCDNPFPLTINITLSKELKHAKYTLEQISSVKVECLFALIFHLCCVFPIHMDYA